MTAEPRERLAIWALTGAAFVLRVLALDREPIGDEARTWISFVVPGPQTAFFHFPAPNNHVLFSLVSAVFLKITGSPTVVLVFWMAVSSLGAWGMWRLLRTLERSVAERSVASLAMASLPLAVMFGIQLRGYGGMLALVPFVIEAYWLARRDPTWRRWFVFAALGAAMCSLHLFAVFVIAALGLHALARPPRPLILLGGFAVLVAALLTMHAGVMPAMWDYALAESHAEQYRGLDLLDVLEFLTGSGWYRIVFVTGILAGILALALERRWDALYLALFPFVLGLAIIGVLDRFVFDRFFLYAAPGLLLLFAAGVWFPVTRIPKRLGHLVWPIAASMFALGWQQLPAFWITSGVAEQFVEQIEERDPTEIYVAGRFHPLLQFYVPSSVELISVEQLQEAAHDHVVVGSLRDPKWTAARPEVSAHLETSYTEVWRPRPNEKARRTELWYAVILVLEDQPR